MDLASVDKLVPVLQTAISPMILISGIGLILLTMTNRLGRIVDRSRVMANELPEMTGDKQKRIDRELHILWQRARLMRMAIGGLTVSALSAAILIVVLFASAWWDMQSAWVIVALFILSMAALCLSLLLFIREIHYSLHAIALEIDAIDRLH